MNRWLREAGKGLVAFLAVLTLIGQSVLPVCADTVDAGKETTSSGYTVSEDKGTYALEYFDRIAVNSVRGTLTIKPGDDFSISFPAGWEQVPSFSVQDDILVVSGRKNDEEQPVEKSSDGSVVVIGEDEPAEGSSANRGAAQPSEAAEEEAASAAVTEAAAETEPEAETEAAETEPEAETETAAETEPEAETEAAETEPEENEAEADDGAVPETVITIPSGIGIDTMRIAMESGDLIITDITANSVTIQSGGGSLVMRGVSLGTVDIYSDAGSFSMAECTFNSLNVGMGEGNIEVQSEDSLARCRMEIKTEDGEITFNGGSQGAQYMQPGNGKRFLTIQVGSGNIVING